MKDFKQPDIPSRYKVEKAIGSGGMGIVYKALDSYLDKDVAIKMLLLSNVEPKLLARFHREAKVASSLNHVNLITVLDFGVTGDGKPYMVMDYADGTTLSALLDHEGTLTIERAIPIFVQICEGLSHAHNRGIFHRDLKPGNVILTDVDSDIPLVRIVDFGLAKPTEADGSRTLTEVGAVIGSPFYMSPEQAMSKEIDSRTDIYSMGCLMFKTLTGRAPIECETALETLSTKCTQVAPRLNNEGYGYPEQLCDMVARCLSISPEDRYQSVDDLLSPLIELSEELNIEPSPLPTIILPPQKAKHKVGRFIIYATIISAIAAVSVIFRTTGTVEQTTVKQPEEAPEVTVGEYASLEKVSTPSPSVSATGKIAYNLCGVSQDDENSVKIYKMEKYLKEHPGAFNWNICNELRHLHSPGSPSKSMEYVDQILKHSILDNYTMHVLSEWNIGKDNAKAIIKLEQKCEIHKDLKYLCAACSIEAGDLQLNLNKPYQARSYYMRVANSKDKDLQAYRDAANARLKGF